MRTHLLVAVIAVLTSTACGAPDVFSSKSELPNCLGPYHPPTGYHMNMDKVLLNEQMIKSLFTGSWQDDSGADHQALFKSEKEICEAVGGIDITVIPVDDFKCDTWGECGGEQSFFTGIKLSQDGSSLLHEYIHVLESEHFVLNTAAHPNWDKNGYFSLDKKFEFLSFSPIIEKD